MSVFQEINKHSLAGHPCSLKCNFFGFSGVQKAIRQRPFHVIPQPKQKHKFKTRQSEGILEI